ncbi:MAG: C_GCAxxG_C_C family protein [Ignavibacteriae bacterium]|nr:C_GCAxxG_C_C family protein [Ignavibacteriota bacterium]
MKNHFEIAISKFDNGYNCAQSVLYSFCEDLNLDKDMALKISCGFGGGMGRTEEVCGTITGGIMVIGMKYGKGSFGEIENTEITYSKARELMHRFSEIHGTYICRKLINGCDLTTAEGQTSFKILDLKNKVCKNCMATVVNYLEEKL